MTTAILAGGESRRMGRDKAALVPGGAGATLLERIARAAEAADGDAVVLVVGRARPENWPLSRVRFAADETPGVGPLGGLATALGQADGDDVLLVACDLPGLTADALRWLRDEAARRHTLADGLAVVNGAQVEPLFSVYTAACLPLVEARLAEGRRSLQGLIAAGRFARVAAPPEVAAALVNVNTPEEWAALGL